MLSTACSPGTDARYPFCRRASSDSDSATRSFAILHHAWALTAHAFQGRTVGQCNRGDGGMVPAPDHVEKLRRGDQPYSLPRMPRGYASGWRPPPESVSPLEGIPSTVEKQLAEGIGRERGPESSLERPAGIANRFADRSHEGGMCWSRGNPASFAGSRWKCSSCRTAHVKQGLRAC